MRRIMVALAALAFAWIWGPAPRGGVPPAPKGVPPLSYAQDRKAPAGKPPATAAAIAAGKRIYQNRCSFCHGESGAGDGPVADYLDPRPRDFTLGIFKFRITASGQLPTDEDLFRTVTRGIPGTAMPEWGPYLSETERWQVIYYVKSFFPEFADPRLDPYKFRVNLSDGVSPGRESIARGREVFQRAKCWECHGREGRGDGKKLSELEDDWGFPIRPFDLTKGWRFKGGGEPKEIYTRFTTGINGTPMPSFVDSLPEKERWHLANYIASLNEGDAGEEVVLRSKQIEGPIPLDPDSPLWKEAPPLRVPLAGQILAGPRWQNPSVDLVQIRSVYHKKEIGFLLEWDDPTQDTVHQEIALQLDRKDTYVKPSQLPRQPGTFRDAVALQFPVKATEGPVKPHFFWGGAGNPVHLWIWQADRQRTGKGSAVEEVNATGFKNPLVPQPPKGQNTRGKGVWKAGRWRAVIVRPLVTPDRDDVQLEGGRLIPFALNAWDGSNGEQGLIMSLSAWNYLHLETQVPLIAYLYALLGMAAMGGAEVWLVRRSRTLDLSEDHANDEG